MHRPWDIPRRTFLKGLGTAIALPFLESMTLPLRGLAAETSSVPTRMAFVYVPNGANMADWTPKTTGALSELPYILQPLQAHQNDFNVLSGLALDGARSHGDGGGDHARANAAFLTGAHPRKTPGADIRAGVSVDQIAAAKIANETRLASLELGCEGNRTAGACDTGYSCAYQAHLAWKTATTPLPPELDPRLVFERLFGNGILGEMEENRERRKRYQQSILDFALEDAKQLQKKLGSTDRRKIDEYLTAVRDLELRMEKAEKFAAQLPDVDRPKGIPGGPDGFQKHIRLMYDLLALAFQTDSTRVATLMIAYDGSNRSYRQIGVPDGHHDLSHHGNDPEKMKKIAEINRFHTTQFSYFLDKLKSIREGEKSLLDSCMVVYGSGIGDGNAHNHDNLPVLFAGRGGGIFPSGQHLRASTETPLTNLYVSMLNAMNVPVERVGDSTGPLKLS